MNTINPTKEVENDNKRIAINNIKRKGYIIAPIENYPNDGNTLRLYTDYPCRIEKGRDEFKNKDRWYVMFYSYFNIEDKNFSNVQQSIDYMQNAYSKWLENQLLLIKKGKLK